MVRREEQLGGLLPAAPEMFLVGNKNQMPEVGTFKEEEMKQEYPHTGPRLPCQTGGSDPVPGCESPVPKTWLIRWVSTKGPSTEAWAAISNSARS